MINFSGMRFEIDANTVSLWISLNNRGRLISNCSKQNALDW